MIEHEIAERPQRRTARHLLEARLPAGDTIDRFDFAAAPSVSKARIMALAEGDAWLTKGMVVSQFASDGKNLFLISQGGRIDLHREGKIKRFDFDCELRSEDVVETGGR